jgi:hypothetical protein
LGHWVKASSGFELNFSNTRGKSDVESAVIMPKHAIIATRPCFSSASRYLRQSGERAVSNREVGDA